MSSRCGSLLLLACLIGCQRENRRFVDASPGAVALNAAEATTVHAGGSRPAPMSASRYDESAYSITQGQQLYTNMNCAGCHGSQGGGGIGPALIDSVWIYGNDPAAVYATIVEGRPNGMPSFRGKLANHDVWELVAYVRSIAGLTRFDARPGRSDNMAVTGSELSRQFNKKRQ